MLKNFIKAIIIVAVCIAACMMLFPNTDEMAGPANGVEADEGIIIFNPVNFRSTPDLSSDENIICQIKYGEVVKMLGLEGDFKKISYQGKVGYVIAESVCEYRIIIDLSDYNWGSEYDSIEEFREFIVNAKSRTKLSGVYLQVQRTFHENYMWKEMVAVLDELKMPYGLYLYSSANEKELAAEEYASYKKLIDGVEMKYNLLPFMVNLEQRGNQAEVVEYYNGILGNNYILYAGADDLKTYGYENMVDVYWLAHYGVCPSLPTKWNTEYDTTYSDLDRAVIWQFTDKGAAKLFGTKHLDVNVVSDEWYRKYVK